METQVLNATEYRNLPLSLLNVSKTNPRRTFDEVALRNWRRASAPRAFSPPCLSGLLPKTASRLCLENGVTVPRNWLSRSPCLSASSR